MVMVCCRCRRKLCGCNIQQYFQLFFWFGMLVGLLSPISIYFTIHNFIDIWPVIQRFFIFLTVNSSWLMLVSPVGYFLLQGKVSNKAVSAAYSVCLCMVIIVSMVCIAFSQAQLVNMMDDKDASVVLGIRDYFDEHGKIPEWLHELQALERCCGFSGPEDFRKLIYPPDKPAIEDVPESCCVRQLVGCNLVLDSFQNKSALSHWIFTDGCRKLIEKRLSNLLDSIAYGCIVIMMTSILLVTIYWCQLTSFLRQSTDSSDNKEVPPPQQLDSMMMVTQNRGGSGGFETRQPDTHQVDDEGGCGSGSVTPGSDFNSRRASMTAIRTVQFETGPGRLVLTKTKSATSTQHHGETKNNNNNINSVIVKPKLPSPSSFTATANGLEEEDDDDPGDRLNVRFIRSKSTSRVSCRRNSVGKVDRRRSKSLVR